MRASVLRVAAQYWVKQAGPLRDVSKLRYQAVFLMGAGGSGKGFVGQRWMKYMPGGGEEGIPRDKNFDERMRQTFSEMDRGLTNLTFEKVVGNLAKKGIRVEAIPGGYAKIPFRVYDNQEVLIPRERWRTDLPKAIYDQVRGLEEVIFSAPKHELPSYWRQVNPDIYKEELAGYMATQPGYVHEMSSEMAKSYFESVLNTGDPLFVDGTGANPGKLITQMNDAKAAGYRTSLVYVYVPLTVNHIRNATRDRKVNPNIVTKAWRQITNSYRQAKGVADKAVVIPNRNDAADIKKYRTEKDAINAFVQGSTEFDDLYALVEANSPTELKDWGAILRPPDEMAALIGKGWTPLDAKTQSSLRSTLSGIPNLVRKFGGVTAWVSLAPQGIRVWIDLRAKGGQIEDDTVYAIKDIEPLIVSKIREAAKGTGKTANSADSAGLIAFDLVAEVADPTTWYGPQTNLHKFFALGNRKEVYYAMPRSEDGYRLSFQIGSGPVRWMNKTRSSTDPAEAKTFASPTDAARAASVHARSLIDIYGLAETDSMTSKIRHFMRLANR